MVVEHLNLEGLVHYGRCILTSLECLKIAKRIAVEVGDGIFMSSYSKSFLDKQVEFKDGNASNLVTETDRKIESLIKEQLQCHFPSFKFMGEEEEAADVNEANLGTEPTWIVDPIDGTTNFVHQFRFTVVSIGLSVQREPVVGVVYCPVSGELFEAIKGRGAFLNGERLSSNGEGVGLSSSLVLTELGATGRGSNIVRKQQQISRLVGHGVHGIRMLGSAAYNLCCVARGVAQLYFEEGIHAWDVCAGCVIVREAGGMIGNLWPGNDQFQLNGRSVVAACNSALMKEFLFLVE